LRGKGGKGGGKVGGLSDLPVVRRQTSGEIGTGIPEDIPDVNTTIVEEEKEVVTTPDLGSLRGIQEQLKRDLKAGDFSYGLEEPKATRARVAEQNKAYMDLVENIYPESKNEFLADALESFGAMILASPEKKGEAFSNRLSELQKAGIKRRDAMRVLRGKAGLKALESKHETEKAIRELPAVLRKRAVSTAEAALEARMKEAKIKELERGPGAKRAPTKIDDNTRKQVDSLIETIANNSFIGKKDKLKVGDIKIERNEIGEILKDLNMKAVRGIASEAFEMVRTGKVDNLTEGVMKIIKERIDSGNLPTKTSVIEDIKSALD